MMLVKDTIRIWHQEKGILFNGENRVEIIMGFIKEIFITLLLFLGI